MQTLGEAGSRLLEENNIAAIQEEYRKINTKWMQLHFELVLGLTVFSMLVEILMLLVLYPLGAISSTLPRYVFKYFLFPAVANGACVAVAFWAVRCRRCTDQVRMYIVSLTLVGNCFVLYMVHNVFSSLALILVLPLIVTTVYGNYRLTSVAGAAVLLLKAGSDLVIQWDPDRPNPLQTETDAANLALSFLLLLAVYVACMVIIYFERQKSRASIKKEMERYRLKRELLKDSLTELYNRKALRQMFETMERSGPETRYILTMIDLDDFKQINDLLGHSQGDLCLRAFGEILQNTGADSTSFRFGGDEFCVLFRNTSQETVVRICEQMQDQLRRFAARENLSLPMTASFGIAEYEQNMTPTQLLENADTALYRAKVNKASVAVYQRDAMCSKAAL